MNKEIIREYISCPQFGDNYYGKWGNLGMKQRQCIYDLLKENKIFDKHIELLEKENKQLEERLDYLVRSNDRSEDEIISLRQELEDSEVCREKAIQYIKDCQLGVDGMDRPYMLLDKKIGRPSSK